MAPLPGHSSLEAVYTSPNTTEAFKHPINSAIVHGDAKAHVKSKTEYLAQLRSSTKLLQEQINTFLTEKMKEEKATTSSQQPRKGDEVEEETYGEENADDG